MARSSAQPPPWQPPPWASTSESGSSDHNDSPQDHRPAASRWTRLRILSLAAIAAIILALIGVYFQPGAQPGGNDAAAVPNQAQSANEAKSGCGKSAPENEGYKVVFKDDFKGSKGSPVDSDKWIYSNGTKYEGGPPQFGTWENQTNTSEPENVSLDGDGCLRITALRNRPVETMDLEDGKFPNTEVKGWTAARIESKDANFKATEGGIMRVDYRMQAPNVKGVEALGYWPAFWMLPGDIRKARMKWPWGCELDLFENVQGKHDELWNVVHCKRNVGTADKPDNWGGSFNEPTGVANNGKAQCQPTACQDALHDFSFEWDRSGKEDELRWYVDGEMTFKFTPTAEQMSDWSTINEHDGFGLIANIAMGGAFPASRNYGGGPFSTTKSGGQLILDYAQVSVKNGSGTTGPEPTKSPDPTVTPTTQPTTTVKPTAPPTTTAPTDPTVPPAPADNNWIKRTQFENADEHPGLTGRTMEGADQGKGVNVNNGNGATFKVDFGNDKVSAVKIRIKTDAKPGISGTLTFKDSKGEIIQPEQNIGHGFSTTWTDIVLPLGSLTGQQEFTLTTEGSKETFAQLDYVEFHKQQGVVSAAISKVKAVFSK